MTPLKMWRRVRSEALPADEEARALVASVRTASWEEMARSRGLAPVGEHKLVLNPDPRKEADF